MSAGCIAVSPGTSGLLHPRIPLSLGAPPAPTSGLVPLVWEARPIFVLFHPGVDDREFGIRNARHSPCHDCDDGPADLRHDCHDGAYNARCAGSVTLWRKCELGGQLSGGGMKHRMMPLLGVQQAIAWPVGLSVRFRMTSSGMVRHLPSICA